MVAHPQDEDPHVHLTPNQDPHHKLKVPKETTLVAEEEVKGVVVHKEEEVEEATLVEVVVPPHQVGVEEVVITMEDLKVPHWNQAIK